MGEPMFFTASDVVFAEATPAQQQKCWELNSKSFWVLHLKGYSGQIIASCETLKKEVLIAEDGICKEGTAYGIASVYTSPTHRRHGWAAFMLRKVRDFLDENSEFSVLYSDIGRSYYANLGWTAFFKTHANLRIISRSTSSSKPTRSLSPSPDQRTRTRPLKREEVPAQCGLEEAAVKAKMQKTPADGKIHVVFKPTHAQMDWHFARAVMQRGKTSVVHGAVTEDGKAWIYWACDMRSKKLKILRMGGWPDERTTDQRLDDTQALLEAALAEASASGYGDVVLWNPDEVTRKACKAVGNLHENDVKIFFEERVDASIPSLRWTGGRDAGKTVWEENQYYAWC